MFDQGGVRKVARPWELTRREFLLAGAGAGLFVGGLGGWPPAGEAEAAPPDLDILTQGHPHAFFFRQTETQARIGDLSYEAWEKRYLPLDGIVGKVLNEENYYGGKNNLPFFLRYKRRNPTKMVLLHYNGTGRRATDEATTRFFPGHFLYYAGTKLTEAIAGRNQRVLHVADTSVFDMKRYRTGLPDDIAITQVGANGIPRWETAEQMRLERINARNKTITVRREMYGTRAHRFPSGSYLAAHVTTGPYRAEDTPEQNIPLWAYNLSTVCPQDSQERNCGHVLADYLGEKLGPEGELASFDGIVFDVFSWIIRFGNPVEDVDVNTDGRADRGMIGGVNVVGLGVERFLRALRKRLPNKLILADGQEPKESQRGFGILNGAESEGFPDKYDITLDHLSRGENIFDYWKENSAPPSFNFMNFRYKEQNPERWRNTFVEPNLEEDRSYRKLRLALASTLFTDSAFTCGGREVHLPPEVPWGEGGPMVRVFDELWKGTEQEPHWLGQPRGPTVHLAKETPDLFRGAGESWPLAFIGRFKGVGVAFSREGTEEAPILAVRSTSSNGALSFVLPGIDVPDMDLFVSLRLRAEPLEDFPASVPRRIEVSATPSGESPSAPNKEFTWVGRESFEASFYYQNVGPGRVSLKFEVEGGQRVYFQRLTAHAAADGRYREYEGGVVFANPSTRSYTFEVGTLFPGVSLRRIPGSENQDPHERVNDGTVVGARLTLPAKDGLFVARSGQM